MSNYYEDVHKRANILAELWYGDPVMRDEALKEILLKHLRTKGYWHYINLDKQKAEEEITPPTPAPKREPVEVRCFCEQIKALFK